MHVCVCLFGCARVRERGEPKQIVGGGGEHVLLLLLCVYEWHRDLCHLKKKRDPV